MEFIFFDGADKKLFVRSDAESASWVVEEMTLQALFPYDPGKVLERGQRIGFIDDNGDLQAFEIRKVRSYEPDHYQEITAEHIAIAELSDEHLDKKEFTDADVYFATSSILADTEWSIIDYPDDIVQTADISRGSVWQGIRTIEDNWNVRIIPWLAYSGTEITGRYLEIKLAEPVWQGVRLSLDKNADEMGVTWDDTNVITAIYGYGGRVENTGTDDTKTLTFEDVVWTATADHPAKPAGQAWLEDPAATALYGRGGRPRYGYYQNSNIEDAETLLEKAWEALKLSNAPQVSIDCQVRDLYRLGYADQPIQLYDEAIIDVRPTGEMLRREIIRLTVDLLDPTATRVTIGTYIPNIVYMQRQTARAARGGGGGGGRGGIGWGGLSGGNDGGQTNQLYEFETEIQANQYQINLRAYQRDMDYVDEILRQAGISLNAQGVIVYATDNANMWQSRLNVQADRISLVVEGTGSNAHIRAASIVSSINDSGSTVAISADKIVLSGETVADAITTEKARMDNLLSGSVTATRLRGTTIYAGSTQGGGFYFQGSHVGLYSCVGTDGNTHSLLGIR